MCKNHVNDMPQHHNHVLFECNIALLKKGQNNPPPQQTHIKHAI